MARSNAVMKRTSVGSGRNAVHTWADIANAEKPIILDCSKLSDATIDRLTDHGAYAKVGDSAAKSDATTAQKFAAMGKTVAALYSGEWRGEREPSDADLIEAMLVVNKKFTRENVVETLRKMSSAEKSVLRVHEPIKKALDAQLEKTAKTTTIDPAALLKKFIHG